MNKSHVYFCVAIFLLLFTNESQSQSLYFPPLTGTAWASVSPASLGWCTDKIDTLMSFLAANRTRAFIVLKDGRIVIEQYFSPFTSDSTWYWASAGKTLTAFLIGIAQHDSILSIDDSTSRYLGNGWTSCPPNKEQLITILHQLTMTTGLKDDVPDPYCTLPTCLIYEADAGKRWAYDTAPYSLLDNVILQASGQRFYNQYFYTKISSRIGMNGLWVQSDYDNLYVSNARSMARFGLLILNRGIWNTDTLLADTSYFHRMTNTSQSLNPSYGYLWWLNGKASYMVPQSQIVIPGSWAPNAPSDMIGALGKNGQFINVVPSQRLIMVRIGEAPDSSYDVPMQFNDDIWRKLNGVICNQTAVEENIGPTQFELKQNYPNPFNPATSISFSLPYRSFVTLKIFDVLGREVTVILSAELPVGTHKYQWNAECFPSGVYFYRLSVMPAAQRGLITTNNRSGQVGTFIETKKLILLR